MPYWWPGEWGEKLKGGDTLMSEGGTILLAEDDPDDVLITQIAFRKARLANPLEVVRDGEEAIAYLKGEGAYADRARYPFPVLLLLDLEMPKVDGFEVLEWLREQPVIGALPVAILTDSTPGPYVKRAYRLGADSYLIKPASPEELLALVKRLRAHWMIVTEASQLQAA
jgi:CheY-like chemotaxis protein